MMQDYPSDEQLDQITKWEFKAPGDFDRFMAFVKSIGNWWPQELFGWKQEGRDFWISTGGWSGNESILAAMEQNMIFWMVCWQEHARGGHYKFTLPDDAVFFRSQRETSP